MTGVAWVTGAGKGIGRQVALELAKEGWLVAASARTISDLSSLVMEAHPFKGSVKEYVLDVTNEKKVIETLSAMAKDLGGIDLAVLNAGTYLRFGVADFSVKSFSRQWNINVMGTVNCLVHTIKQMKIKGTGHIVVVSSLSAYRGLPLAGAYGASKAALTNMCEALKPELEQLNIRLAIVHPGFVRTPLTSFNEFPMPFLMEVDDAARRIVKGIGKGQFEIAFPLLFTLIMKFIRLIPYSIYFAITRRLIRK